METVRIEAVGIVGRTTHVFLEMWPFQQVIELKQKIGAVILQNPETMRLFIFNNFEVHELDNSQFMAQFPVYLGGNLLVFYE